MKRNNPSKIVDFLMIAVVLTIAIAAYAQQKTEKNEKSELSCPMMKKQTNENKSHEDCPMIKKGESQTERIKTDDASNRSDHHKMVLENGAKEMKFSQTATTHHFFIMKDGGAIQVEANDAKDTENRDKIRAHLIEIAEEFQSGIFTTPFAVHGQISPGTAEMDKLKNEIRYAYKETEKGARVRITTVNPQALTAIWDFLKFQIEEHQTGDSTSIEN